MFQDVIKQLDDELQGIAIGENQRKVEVIREKFQADALIVYRSNAYLNDIILCSNTDLRVLTASHYLANTKFKFTKKRERWQEMDPKKTGIR